MRNPIAQLCRWWVARRKLRRERELAAGRAYAKSRLDVGIRLGNPSITLVSLVLQAESVFDFGDFERGMLCEVEAFKKARANG